MYVSRADDARIAEIEKVVGTMHGEVTVMLNALVAKGESSNLVPAISPAMAGALIDLTKSAVQTQSDTAEILVRIPDRNLGLRLAEVLAGINENTELLKLMKREAPPDNFSEVLALLNSKFGSVGKQIDTVRERQEIGNGHLQATNAKLDGVSNKIDSAYRDVETIKADTTKTVRIAQSTRLAIGRLPSLKGRADSYDTIAGGISRLIRHDRALTQRWLRLAALDEQKSILLEAPAKKTSCDDAQKCEPYAQVTNTSEGSPSVSAPAPTQRLTTVVEPRDDQ